MIYIIYSVYIFLITAVPIALFGYLPYFLLTKKGYKKIGICILSIITLCSIYSTYTAFYPTDSFYKEEFENNTGLDFPKSGNILIKYASYPDFHGDYSASALFKTDKKDFNQLISAIDKDSKFQLDTMRIKFNLSNFGKNSIENFTKWYTLNGQDRDLTFTISFNNSDTLIKIQRDSW